MTVSRAAPHAKSPPQAAPLRLGARTDPAEARAEAAARRLTAPDAAPAERLRRGGLLQSTALPLGAGAPLSTSERAYFEPRLGRPLDHLRLHRGPAARLAARAIGASAFAVDNHVALADERPATLAHELAHSAECERGVVRRNAMGQAMLTRSFHDSEVRGLSDVELQGVYDFLNNLATGDKTLLDDPGFTGNYFLVRNELQRRANAKAEPPKPPEKKPVPLPAVTDSGGPGMLLAVVSAIAKMQQIASDEANDGVFSIEWEGASHRITGTEAAKLRNSAQAQIRDALPAVSNRSAKARGLYQSQSDVDKQHWVVAPIIKFVGNIKDPGPVMLGLAASADGQVQAARDALAKGDYVSAAALLVSAERKARQADAMAHAYWEDIIATGEVTVTVLEGVRDASFAIVAVLAIVISGGAALGVGGMTASMASSAGTIALFTPVVARVGEGIAKQAMGDKVDWGNIAIEAAVAAVMYRFGGPLADKIGGGLTNLLIAKAGRTIAKELIVKAVAGVIVGRGATIVQTAARAIASRAGDKPATWAQFVHELSEQMLDPKAGLFDLVAIALGVGTGVKARGPAGPAKPAAPGEPEPQPAAKADAAPAKPPQATKEPVAPKPPVPAGEVVEPAAKPAPASPPVKEPVKPSGPAGDYVEPAAKPVAPKPAKPAPPPETMAGAGKGGPPAPEPSARPAASPGLAEHEQWMADAVKTKLDKRPPPLPKPGAPPVKAGETQYGLGSMDEAMRVYDDFRARAPGREVGVYRNAHTGEYAVVAGQEGSVRGPLKGEPMAWDNVVHNHPNPDNALTFRNPAPQDLSGTVRGMMRGDRPVTTLIEHDAPGGGRRFTAVTVSPPKGRVDIQYQRPEGGIERRSFPDIESFSKDWGSRKVYVDPDSVHYGDMMKSADASYRDEYTRSGSPPEQTMAGLGKGEPAAGKPTVASELAKGAAERQRLASLPDEALIAEARQASQRLDAARKAGKVTPDALNAAERSMRVLRDRHAAAPNPAVKTALDEAVASYSASVDKGSYLMLSRNEAGKVQGGAMLPGQKAMSPRELYETVVAERGFDNSIPMGKTPEVDGKPVPGAKGAIMMEAEAELARLKALKTPDQKERQKMNRLERELAISTLGGKGGPAGSGYNTYAVVQIEDAHGNVVASAQGKYVGAKHAEEIAIDILRGALGGRKIPGAKIVVVGDREVCPDVCRPALRALAVDIEAQRADGYVYKRPKASGSGLASEKTTARTATSASVHDQLQGATGQPTPLSQESLEIYSKP